MSLWFPVILSVVIVLLGILTITLAVSLEEKVKEIRKVRSQKKSSEVKVGLIVEQIAPFLNDFGYDPKNCHFIGKPVDYVVFDKEGIHFVEVKSGSSKLNNIQREIKKAVEEGSVTFEVYRVKGDG